MAGRGRSAEGCVHRGQLNLIVVVRPAVLQLLHICCSTSSYEWRSSGNMGTNWRLFLDTDRNTIKRTYPLYPHLSDAEIHLRTSVHTFCKIVFVCGWLADSRACYCPAAEHHAFCDHCKGLDKDKCSRTTLHFWTFLAAKWYTMLAMSGEGTGRSGFCCGCGCASAVFF